MELIFHPFIFLKLQEVNIMNKDFEKWILDGGNYPLIFTKMPSFVKEVDG